jgi:putative tryptophan/tyrosine transport system substrate-binding protein
MKIDERWIQGDFGRFPDLAADLVRLRVAVILAVGPPGARAAMAATKTIPIVFQMGEDPVEPPDALRDLPAPASWNGCEH